MAAPSAPAIDRSIAAKASSTRERSGRMTRKQADLLAAPGPRLGATPPSRGRPRVITDRPARPGCSHSTMPCGAKVDDPVTIRILVRGAADHQTKKVPTFNL